MDHINELISQGRYDDLVWREILKSQRVARRERDMQLRELFFQDLLEDSGLKDDKRSRLIFEKAWEDGYSGGYSYVYRQWVDLLNFLEKLEK